MVAEGPNATRSVRHRADGLVLVADKDNSRVQAFLDLAADVSLSLQGPATVAPGAAYSYTVRVSNRGPATASGIGVSLTLPDHVTFLGDNVDTGCLAVRGRMAVIGAEDGTVFVSVDAGERWTAVAKGLAPALMKRR